MQVLIYVNLESLATSVSGTYHLNLVLVLTYMENYYVVVSKMPDNVSIDVVLETVGVLMEKLIMPGYDVLLYVKVDET